MTNESGQAFIELVWHLEEENADERTVTIVASKEDMATSAMEGVEGAASFSV